MLLIQAFPHTSDKFPGQWNFWGLKKIPLLIFLPSHITTPVAALRQQSAGSGNTLAYVFAVQMFNRFNLI